MDAPVGKYPPPAVVNHLLVTGGDFPQLVVVVGTPSSVDHGHQRVHGPESFDASIELPATHATGGDVRGTKLSVPKSVPSRDTPHHRPLICGPLAGNQDHFQAV